MPGEPHPNRYVKVGACAACNGFGNILTVDEAKVIPNPNLSIAEGALHPFNMPSASSDRRLLLGYCKKEKIDVKAFKEFFDLLQDHPVETCKILDVRIEQRGLCHRDQPVIALFLALQHARHYSRPYEQRQ